MALELAVRVFYNFGRMSNYQNLTKTLVLKIEGSELTFGHSFNRVLSNFIATEREVFRLLETVIVTCLLVEAIIKNQLAKINPALMLKELKAEDIVLISGEAERLIVPTNREMSDVATAPILELTRRFSTIEDISEYEKGLKSLFAVRNKIVHTLPEVTLSETDITLLLTKYAFPFIHNYVDVSPHKWDDMEKISKVASSRFALHLSKKILEYGRNHKNANGDLVESKVDELNDGSKNEILSSSELLCPACGNEKMLYLMDIENNTNDESDLPLINYYARCQHCSISLQQDEIEEVIKNYEQYFAPSKQQLSRWLNVLN